MLNIAYKYDPHKNHPAFIYMKWLNTNVDMHAQKFIARQTFKREIFQKL